MLFIFVLPNSTYQFVRKATTFSIDYLVIGGIRVYIQILDWFSPQYPDEDKSDDKDPRDQSK